MYIVFGNRVIDSKDIKEVIEKNTKFKVIKDMSKGSKREDIVAFNLSIDINALNEMMEEEVDLNELTEDELFEEYFALAEETSASIEEYIPQESIFDVRAYKLDESDNDLKLVMCMAHESLGEPRLRDIMKRLLTQAE